MLPSYLWKECPPVVIVLVSNAMGNPQLDNPQRVLSLTPSKNIANASRLFEQIHTVPHFKPSLFRVLRELFYSDSPSDSPSRTPRGADADAVPHAVAHAVAHAVPHAVPHADAHRIS